MKFGCALELIKNGKRVKRSIWNDTHIKLMTISYNETSFTLFIGTNDNTPWSPTQDDLLNEDWIQITKPG